VVTRYLSSTCALFSTCDLPNGRADVMLISVAEYESMQETLDILGDAEAVADLRQSREDFAAGDTYTAAQVRAELEQRRRLGTQ
jgi:antitoxin YefM